MLGAPAGVAEEALGRFDVASIHYCAYIYVLVAGRYSDT